MIYHFSDYGPFGFMERFDPDFICNASDDGGRYTYANQPEICKWNLGKFAEAIGEAVPVEETKEIIEETYDEAFQQHYRQLMAEKLGLTLVNDQNPSIIGDLADSLMSTMHKTGTDFTNAFRILCEMPYPSSSESFGIKKEKLLQKLLSQCCTVEDLKKSFRYNISWV